MSLANRVSIAIGVFNFWVQLNNDLGMRMTETLSSHLQKKDEKNEKARKSEKDFC